MKALARLRASWRRFPAWLRAAIHTGWQTSGAMFLVTLLGFLDDVKKWAGDTSGHFPKVDTLGKATAALFVGIVAAVITAVFRKVKPPVATAPAPDAAHPVNQGPAV